MKTHKFFLYTPTFCLLLLCAWQNFAQVFASSNPKQPVVISEVLTGDSVRLEGGKILRYAGIQAPELESAIPLVREYGQNSKKFNESLVVGKKLYLEWDSQVRDNQNNLLAYAYLDDGTFVNLEIVRAGHAKLRIVPPNLRYSGILNKAEIQAKRDKKGLWLKEPVNPYINEQYIGEINTKTYYLPNSPELERIPEAHLIKFKSRVEAKAAGYRACNTCRDRELEA